MATKFSELYERFVGQINDYSIVRMGQEVAEKTFEGYLKSSISKFNQCKIDLKDRDETAKAFNQTLGDEEIDVLVTLMIVEYLKPQVLHSQKMKMMLSDSDYKSYSQANQLNAMLMLYKQFQKDADLVKTNYSYIKGKMEDLK